jgi:hypothetical protein
VRFGLETLAEFKQLLVAQVHRQSPPSVVAVTAL